MKIRKEDLEIIKYTSREILLTLFDLTTPFFSASRMYRQSVRKYLNQRAIDRSDFINHLYYLKKQKYIHIFIEGKEKYVELTPKGARHIKICALDSLEIARPIKWDGKWRVVIFDVPEKLHRNRDVLRDNLKRMDFIQIQKSVYVHPFECTNEITILSEILNTKKFVTIMISEIIQGEDKIIQHFLNNGTLLKSDLKHSNLKHP